MHSISFYGTKFKNSNDKTRCDTIQKSFTSFIRNDFFPWILIVLILNRKDWKRPVILILILYWFLQSTGDFLQSFIFYKPSDEYRNYNPVTQTYWYIFNALAYLFWVSGEIIGDWYPYLRTKAIVQSDEIMKPIHSICCIYNVIKVLQIIINFVIIPFSINQEEEKANKYLIMFRIIWWSIICVIQMASLIYDIYVIFALKNTLYNRLENFKRKFNSFLEKFKQVSEYRFFISIIISMLFIPCAVFQIIFFVKLKIKDDPKIKNLSDEIENFRVIGLRFTYTFMYIDQILLRFYVLKSKVKHVTTQGTQFSRNSVDNSFDSQHIILSSYFPQIQKSPKSPRSPQSSQSPQSPRMSSPTLLSPPSMSNTNITSSRFSVYSNEPHSPYISSSISLNISSASNSNANNSGQSVYSNEQETSYNSASLLLPNNQKSPYYSKNYKKNIKI
jgi:large-conductance mechanosensitive channel